MKKKGQAEKTVGLVVVLAGVLAYFGLFGTFSPGCTGIFGWIGSILGLCITYNQPIGLLLVLAGLGIYILGVKK